MKKALYYLLTLTQTLQIYPSLSVSLLEDKKPLQEDSNIFFKNIFINAKD